MDNGGGVGKMYKAGAQFRSRKFTARPPSFAATIAHTTLSHRTRFMNAILSQHVICGFDMHINDSCCFLCRHTLHHIMLRYGRR
jgi:hypothetical protein